MRIVMRTALSGFRSAPSRRAGWLEQSASSRILDGLNTYLGNYIGEFLGELSFSAFFLLTSIVWLQLPRPHKWIGWVGVGTAVLGLVGMFRNVTATVAPIAALNNYLLPAFMVILGVALVRLPAV